MASNGDSGRESDEGLLERYVTAVAIGTSQTQDDADVQKALELVRNLKCQVLARMRRGGIPEGT